MPIQFQQQFNVANTALMSYSDATVQALGFVQRSGAARRITSITCGYIDKLNIGQASPYQHNIVCGRMTIFVGDLGLTAQTNKDDIISNYQPFVAPITFQNVGKVVLDVPVIDFYKEDFSYDTLVFAAGDVITVLLSTGYSAIDASFTSYSQKIGYLNVFGQNIEQSQKDGDFRYTLR